MGSGLAATSCALFAEAGCVDWHRYFNREYRSPLPPRVGRVLCIVFMFVCAMKIFGKLLDAAQGSQTFLALWVFATILGAVAGVASARRCLRGDLSESDANKWYLRFALAHCVIIVSLQLLYPAQFSAIAASLYNNGGFHLLGWTAGSFVIAGCICGLRCLPASPKGA